MLGLPAHEVNALVNGNTVEPTVELGNSLEGIEALVGFEEHFLREVECIVGVGDNGTDDALDPVAVAQIDEIENGGFACLKAIDENGIGVNGGRRKLRKRNAHRSLRPADNIKKRLVTTART